MAEQTISITLNGEAKEVAADQTGVQLFAEDKNIIAVRLNGEPRDLYTELHDGDVVEPIALDSEDGLAIMRHSATHVMAQAVQEIRPDAKLGVGPVIKDGFYYDFDVETPFTPDDLKEIEKRMQRIIKSSQSFRRRKHHYSFVQTPHITKGGLYETSGHLHWYKDGMYPAMRLDEEKDENGNVVKQGFDYYLKPMNCPMHNLIFKSRQRSYRELPLRLFEFGTVYRYEKSGEVHGLTRVRGLTQDDSHIYCTREQMKDELKNLLTFVLGLLKDFGLDDFYLELSTKDPHKYVGSDEIWEEATNTLAEVAKESGLELVDDPCGAAFYGPKISVQARDAIGRTWQVSTIQLDFNLPERFGLEYIAADGTHQRPVMIHRALFGSIERFFAVLLEHYAGAFPAWLAPVQVLGVPVADEFAPHLQQFIASLEEETVRCEIDMSDDRFGKKIRNASKSKVPFILIVGEEDMNNNAVSFRFRDGSQLNGVPVDEAKAQIMTVLKKRVQVNNVDDFKAAIAD